MKFSDINDILTREVGAAEVHTSRRKKPAPVSAFIRKTVLVHLAMRENSDGSGAYPSKSRIARELECSRRAVQLALDTLQEPTRYVPPLINRVGTRRTRKGPVDIFKIDLAAVALLPKVKRDDDEEEIVTPQVRTEFTSGVNDIHSKGELGSQVGVNDIHTEPHTEPQNNQKKTKPHGSQQKQADEEQDNVSLLHAFIKAYPKKGEAIEVLRAWENAIDRNHDPQIIVKAAEHLKRAVEAGVIQAKYQPKPQEWLRNDGWDEPSPYIPGSDWLPKDMIQ